MVQIVSVDPAGFRRLSTHALALVAAVGVTITGMAAVPVAEMRAASDADSPPGQALPAQVELDLKPLPAAVAPTLPAPTQGADQTQALVVFNPSLGLPQWLR